MVDGGLTVFNAAGRDYCLAEMVKEVCGQYVEGKCSLDEFMEMYEGVLLSAAMEQDRRRSEPGNERVYVG